MLREEKEQFKHYEDLEFFLVEVKQVELIKVRSYKDDIKYAMKVVEIF